MVPRSFTEKPFLDRTKQRTLEPKLARRLERFLPANPLEPVTRIFFASQNSCVGDPCNILRCLANTRFTMAYVIRLCRSKLSVFFTDDVFFFYLGICRQATPPPR